MDRRSNPAWMPAASDVASAERVSRFLRACTDGCARACHHRSGGLRRPPPPALIGALRSNQFLLLGLVVVQLGLVFFLAARVTKLAPGLAAGLFVAYSALTGVTMSLVLLAYTGESVVTTFAVTAAMFGALALYGTTTTRSLAGLGQFAFMGLIGLIIASLVACSGRATPSSS